MVIHGIVGNSCVFTGAKLVLITVNLRSCKITLCRKKTNHQAGPSFDSKHFQYFPRGISRSGLLYRGFDIRIELKLPNDAGVTPPPPARWPVRRAPRHFQSIFSGSQRQDVDKRYEVYQGWLPTRCGGKRGPDLHSQCSRPLQLEDHYG